MRNNKTKYAYIFGLIMFTMSISMFYYLFLIVTPAPLTLENHFGFFIWSAVPSVMLIFALVKKHLLSFFVLLIAIVGASTSLIYESYLAQVNNTGNLGAVLSYILILIFAIACTLLIEGILIVIRMIQRKK